jgi:hypothetical protein
MSAGAVGWGEMLLLLRGSGMTHADEIARMGAEVRQLFARMDVIDDARAVLAMKEVAALLRPLGLSFRQVVQEIEARGLLLPTKIAAAIQLMDSDTLSEGESALGAARRLMKSCGLTFESMIAALEQGLGNSGEIERLRRTNRATVDDIAQSRNAHEAAVEEIQHLRSAHQAAVAKAKKMKAELRVRSFLLVVELLLCVWLASTLLSLVRSESPEVLLSPAIRASEQFAIPSAPQIDHSDDNTPPSVAEQNDDTLSPEPAEPTSVGQGAPHRVPLPLPRPPERDLLGRPAPPAHGPSIRAGFARKVFATDALQRQNRSEVRGPFQLEWP